MDWLEIAKMLLPAAAAWASVKSAIAVALERSSEAKASAAAAHKRIDSLITNRSHHGNT